MFELKLLKKIMKEYETLLKKYETKLDDLTIDDYKQIIGEVKLFWYRNRVALRYIIDEIEEKDNVAFLAGAVFLDIKNDGHLEYVLVGENRIINDPILKMATFYKGGEDEINFEYTNQYLKDCIEDILLLFREFCEDFYIIPIDFITDSECDEYYRSINEVANKMVLSMFSQKYKTIDEFFKDNNPYEDIESKMLSHIRDSLVINDLGDATLSLRDKFEIYRIENQKKMPYMKDISEHYFFYLTVVQYCMQSIAIALTMKSYNIIPFIRNDVVFQYFNIVFYSNIIKGFSVKDYMNAYVPYVIQKTINFSDKEYQNVKDKLGNGKMVNAIVNSFHDGQIPSVGDIVKCTEVYMDCNE